MLAWLWLTFEAETSFSCPTNLYGATARDKAASCTSDTAWIFFSESSKSLLPELVQLPEIRPPPVHQIPQVWRSFSQSFYLLTWHCNSVTQIFLGKTWTPIPVSCCPVYAAGKCQFSFHKWITLIFKVRHWSAIPTSHFSMDIGCQRFFPLILSADWAL